MVFTGRFLPGMAVLLIALVIYGCSPVPAAPAAAPTLNTTALVEQIVQTLEAKMTRAAPQATSQPPAAATLLPLAPSSTAAPLPTAQLAVFPSPTASPAGPIVTLTAAPVVLPTPLFAVIHVTTSVNHIDITNTCPPGYDFLFSGAITTNGPGTVTYNWEFSDYNKTATQTLTFTSAGTQSISTDWNLGKDGKTPGGNPYKGWARITIVQPNNQVFPRVPFNFTCQ